MARIALQSLPKNGQLFAILCQIRRQLFVRFALRCHIHIVRAIELFPNAKFDANPNIDPQNPTRQIDFFVCIGRRRIVISYGNARYSFDKRIEDELCRRLATFGH